MKNFWFKNFFIVLAVIFLVNSSWAGPYHGQRFPSDRHFEQLAFAGGFVFVKSLGRYKNPDGSQTVYFIKVKENRTQLDAICVYRLDTGFWMVTGSALKRSPAIILELKQ